MMDDLTEGNTKLINSRLDPFHTFTDPFHPGSIAGAIRAGFGRLGRAPISPSSPMYVEVGPTSHDAIRNGVKFGVDEYWCRAFQSGRGRPRGGPRPRQTQGVVFNVQRAQL